MKLLTEEIKKALPALYSQEDKGEAAVVQADGCFPGARITTNRGPFTRSPNGDKNMTFDEKIKSFADLVERQQREEYKQNFPKTEKVLIDNCCTVTTKQGNKYIKVDVDGLQGILGKLMVEIATGEIYGIKAYGVIHRGHPYGTLDTTALFWWGSYYPRKLVI